MTLFERDLSCQRAGFPTIQLWRRLRNSDDENHSLCDRSASGRSRRSTPPPVR
jgi:hypothetical protein